METTIIIAESPPKAKSQKKGIKDKGVIWTTAVGHLYTLKKTKYPQSMKELPITLDLSDYTVLYEPDPGKQKRINEINNLIYTNVKTGSLVQIVNGCDTDPEGEVIFRNIINGYEAKYGKLNIPIKRLDFNEESPAAFKKAYENLVPLSKYDKLAKRGYGRAFMDMLYGFNLSPALSMKYEAKLSAGSIQTPLLGIVYDREIAIENFKPETEYKKVFKADNGDLFNSPKSSNQKEIENLKLKSNNIRQENVDEKLQIQPKLYSSDKLKKKLASKIRKTQEEVTAVMQSCYDKGLITYPRTDFDFIQPDEAKEIENTYLNYNYKGINLSHSFNKKNIKKIKLKVKGDEDADSGKNHTAITLSKTTNVFTDPDLKSQLLSLTQDEQICFNLVAINTLCQLLPPLKYSQVNFIIELNNNTQIKNNRNTLISNGYVDINKVFDKIYHLKGLTIKDANLPIPQKIESDSIESSLTKPPSYFTESDLEIYMKTDVFKDYLKDEDPTEKDEVDLLKQITFGEDSTRTTHITNLRTKGYALLEDGVLKLTKAGRQYAKELKTMNLPLIDLAKRVELEKGFLSLLGDKSVDTYVEEINSDILHLLPIIENFQTTTEITNGNMRKESQDGFIEYKNEKGNKMYIVEDKYIVLPITIGKEKIRKLIELDKETPLEENKEYNDILVKQIKRNGGKIFLILDTPNEVVSYKSKSGKTFYKYKNYIVLNKYGSYKLPKQVIIDIVDNGKTSQPEIVSHELEDKMIKIKIDFSKIAPKEGEVFETKSKTGFMCNNVFFSKTPIYQDPMTITKTDVSKMVKDGFVIKEDGNTKYQLILAGVNEQNGRKFAKIKKQLDPNQ